MPKSEAYDNQQLLDELVDNLYELMLDEVQTPRADALSHVNLQGAVRVAYVRVRNEIDAWFRR